MHARVYTKCQSHQEGPKGHSGLIYICAPASHNNPRQAVPGMLARVPCRILGLLRRLGSRGRFEA